MKRHLLKHLMAIAIAALSSLYAQAQTFMVDYMSYHQATAPAMGNLALQKDDATQTYYVAQQTTPSDYHSILWSEMDANHNILRTYKYTAMIFPPDGDEMIPNENMHITVRDINYYGNQVIIVGAYIEEAVDRGGFMFAADKTTGAFQWFQKFTGVYTLGSVECNDDIAGAIAVGWRDNIAGGGNHIMQNSVGSGVIMRVDGTGSIVWQRDVESAKYDANPNLTPSLYNMLFQLKRIGDDQYAAVGQLGTFLNFTFPYNDGDGALVIFNSSGLIQQNLSLGNMQEVSFFGNQNPQFEDLQSLTTCSDGDLVLAGQIIEFDGTNFYSQCPGPTPTIAGVWVTKINPVSHVIAWSKIFSSWPGAYEPDNFPHPGNIKIENDGTDNFALIFKTYFNGAMKLDINGNIVYSRSINYPGDLCAQLDISTGFGNTDIVSVGYVFNGTGMATTLFDSRVWAMCSTGDFEPEVGEHVYDIFGNRWQDYTTLPAAVIFSEPSETITNNVVCPKDEYTGDGEEGEGNGPRLAENEVQVTQDIASNTVMIKAPAGETYKGKLLNSIGQTIQLLDNVEQRYTLNTSSLAAGIYYLQLYNGKHSTTKAVMIK